MDGASARSKKRQNKKKHTQVKKKEATSNGGSEDVSYDSDYDDDCASVCSDASSTVSAMGGADDLEDGGVEHHIDFESVLLENIEGARQKSAKSRQTSLGEVKKALCKRYMNEIILSRKETILDIIEKLIKKGQKEDRVLSAGIACALCIQLGEGESLRVFTTLKPILIAVINDDTVSPLARASAASALGISCFIGAEDINDTATCLAALKVVFSKKIPSDPAHHVAFTHAMLAWGLLLTVASESVVQEQMEGSLGIICKILENGDLNLRIAAGETVALMFELSREMDYTLATGSLNNLYSLLRDLANESGRHKGKREKRQQKSSFRDILKSVESGSAPEELIKFGSEFISMTSWTWLCRYNRFKEAVGSGINTHLSSNMLLREIFGLGIPVAKDLKECKTNKYERQWINQASNKARNLKRNQKRDNKLATVDL